MSAKNGLDFGHHPIFSSQAPFLRWLLARLATNCNSGEASFKNIELTFEFKIIDLVIVGRIPKNPEVVENCNEILYWKHEWVGFRVTESGTENSNIFEVVIEQNGALEHAIVKRIYSGSIVACNEFGMYPTNPQQKFQTENPFRIEDLLKVDKIVGYITLTRNFPPPAPIAISLCNIIDNLNLPWKNQYQFEALTAEEVLTDYPDEGGSIDESEANQYDNKIYVKNPFDNYLYISIGEFTPDGHNVKVRLFDSTLKEIFTNSNLQFNSCIEIPTESIPNGIYYLELTSENENKIFKLIKS